MTDKATAKLIYWALITLAISVPFAALSVAVTNKIHLRPIALSLFAGSAIASVSAVYGDD